jgi:hypothetical protein
LARNARPVAELGDQVDMCRLDGDASGIERGIPLVDDPARVGPVTKLGVDETSCLGSNRAHATLYARDWSDLQAASSSTWSKAAPPLTYTGGANNRTRHGWRAS